MALTERLQILIQASSGGAVREFNQLAGAAGKTGTALTKTQVAAGAFKGVIGAVGLTTIATGMAQFAQRSIEAASALEEAQSAAQQVFGSSFPKIDKFGRETADALNLSERAALEFSSSFGSIFKGAELGQQAVVDLTLAMTAFAADLASFRDLSVEEAFTKIQSGLAGEVETLRRFGINLSASKVQAEAYALGLANVGDKLTESQKIQARASLILKEGADIMGDVARTSDSYANTQRDLQETTEELSATIGGFLTPEMTKNLQVLALLVDAVSGLKDANSDAESSTVDLGGALSDATNPLATLWNGFTGVRDTLLDLTGVTDDHTESTKGSYEALYENAAATLESGSASDALTEALDATAESAEDQEQAIEDLASAVEDLGAKFRDADESSDDLTQAIKDARQPLRDVKEAQNRLERATTDTERAQARQELQTAKASVTLKGNSQAAIDNRGRLRDLATQTLRTASTYITLDGDTDRATAATRTGRRAFIAVAVQMGATREQARRLASQYGLVPKNVNTSVRASGITQAQAAAIGYKGALDKIPRYIETIIVQKRLEARIGGSLAGDQSGLRKRAAGGPVAAGTTYMVGEQGPELLTLRGGNGIITSTSKTRPQQKQPQPPVVYNVYGYPDDQVMRRLEQHQRRNDLRARLAG